MTAVTDAVTAVTGAVTGVTIDRRPFGLEAANAATLGSPTDPNV